MIVNKKLFIIEIGMALVVIGLIVSIFYVDFDLGIVKIVSQKTLMAQYMDIQSLDEKLEASKTNYEASIKAVETSKSDFKRQKEEYEAITDETIAIIREATTDEKYSIEYMWIKLGNYAKSNNLLISLIEPGGTAQVETPPASTTPTTTPTTTTPPETTTPTTTPTTTTPPATTTPTSVSSGDELIISVKGDYMDVSEFIFEIENDAELRFKLDKIKMEYAGSNEITASFAVKNLKFIK